jgi:hypothetical protein
MVDVHVRPQVRAPLGEVPRGLQDALGRRSRLRNDVNLWHGSMLLLRQFSRELVSEP